MFYEYHTCILPTCICPTKHPQKIFSLITHHPTPLPTLETEKPSSFMCSTGTHWPRRYSRHCTWPWGHGKSIHFKISIVHLHSSFVTLLLESFFFFLLLLGYLTLVSACSELFYNLPPKAEKYKFSQNCTHSSLERSHKNLKQAMKK